MHKIIVVSLLGHPSRCFLTLQKIVAAFATAAQQLFAPPDKMQSNERLQNEGTKQQTIRT